MAKVLIYATRYCPFCVMARRLFKAKGVEVEEIPVDCDTGRRSEMREKCGRYTVPQIWIGERHIGGYEEVCRLERSGELDQLLNQGST